jgi:DNA primase
MNLFSYLKHKVSILDVVNEYTHLKQAGSYWKGHCPFHNEKTASFTVSPAKEIFYCFGCHAAGDVISFIAKIEQCSQLEAAHQIAERHRIELPADLITKGNELTISEQRRYHDLVKLVAMWCHEQLMKTPATLHYLLKRGIAKDTMRLFTLGYFPGGHLRIKELVVHMRNQGFLVSDLLASGILMESKTVLYSPFEERIIFPIKDHVGRFCGFGGRIFKSTDERPKYYNSREHANFNKGSLLFGLDMAKKSMQHKEQAFLVEGYTDLISMVQHGYPNTIATLGTACTIEHLKTLARYTKQLYVVYDGDRAGNEAMIRLTNLCWQVSLELKVISLPAQEDPASFLSKGNSLVELIANAKDIFMFFIDAMGEGFTNKALPEKLHAIRRLLGVIDMVEDAITQDLLLARATHVTGIPFESLKQELARLQASGTTKPVQPEIAINHTKTLSSFDNAAYHEQRLEKKLFFAILNNIELLNKGNLEFMIEYFPLPFSAILKKFRHQEARVPSMDFVSFFDTLDDHEKKFVSKVLVEFQEVPDPTLFDQLFAQFYRKNWKIMVNDMKMKLNEAQRCENVQEQQKILQSFLELKKKLLTLNRP